MASTARAAGAGCLFRALRSYALFLLCAVVLVEAIGYGLAAHRTSRADKAWASEAEAMDAFAARFPAAPDSPAALKLDELTRPLGVRMVRRPSEPGRWSGENDELLKALSLAIVKLGRSTSGTPTRLPAAAEALLGRERARLDAIIHHILDGGSLRWEQDIAKGTGAPIPSLLGHRQLSSLLLGRAWIAARDGGFAEAESALDASWRLNSSYSDRPDLLSQLISVAVGSMEYGVLRHIPQPGPVWFDRIKDRSFVRRLPVSLQLEAWNWMHYTRGYWGVFDVSYMEDGRVPPRGWGSIPRFLTTPYIRLSMSGMSEALLRARRDLGEQRRCDLDMESYSRQTEDSFPRWNIIGRIGIPPIVRAWASLRHADLDRELTERVLSARAERAASGRWPVASVPSAVCEGVSWDFEAAADSTLHIKASTQPFHEADPNWDWAIRVRP